MNTVVHPTPGAHNRAPVERILPSPNNDIQRRLRRLVHEAGLPYDASIGARDLRLEHSILLPTAGLLVTATRAQAPLLEANCITLAHVADLDVLLLRFSRASGGGPASFGASACLIQHDAAGDIVSREGYSALVLPYRGLLLRTTLPDRPDWHVSPAGMIAAVPADLIKACGCTPTVAQPRSA